MWYICDENLWTRAHANFVSEIAPSRICVPNMRPCYIPHLTDVHLMGVYLMGVYLMGVYLTGMHLTGVHLTGVHLMGVYLTGVYAMGMHLIGHASHKRVPRGVGHRMHPFLLSRIRNCCFWWSLA
jgi:hypothetical protein